MQSLRADLDAAEATRDAALASEAAATRAAKELQCRVDALLLEASAKGDSGPMTQDEASQLREEVKRLKGIEQKYEQFKNLFSS